MEPGACQEGGLTLLLNSHGETMNFEWHQTPNTPRARGPAMCYHNGLGSARDLGLILFSQLEFSATNANHNSF